MLEQFRTETGRNETGHYHRVTCTLCGWRVGTCGSGTAFEHAFAQTLRPLSDARQPTGPMWATRLHKMLHMTHTHYTYRHLSGYQDFLWYQTEQAAHQAAGDTEHEIVTGTCDQSGGTCMPVTLGIPTPEWKEEPMTPEELETAMQAALDSVTRDYFHPALLAAGIENPEQYQLALTEPPAELDEAEYAVATLAVADTADTISHHLAAEPGDTPRQVANRLIASMLEPEPDCALDMGWTFETAAMQACAVTLLAVADPHRAIDAWVGKYFSCEDGLWGFTDPTNGDPTAVIALLDAIWPEWKD